MGFTTVINIHRKQDIISTALQRSITDDGLAYNHNGKGTPLLLIHGVGLCSKS